jgi:hypothetical protein
MLCRQVGWRVGKIGLQTQQVREEWGRGTGQFTVQPQRLVFLIEPPARVGTVDLIAPELVSGVHTFLHYLKSPRKS